MPHARWIRSHAGHVLYRICFYRCSTVVWRVVVAWLRRSLCYFCGCDCDCGLWTVTASPLFDKMTALSLAPVPDSRENLFAAIVQKAFRLPTLAAARAFRGAVLVTDSSGHDIAAHFFSDLDSFVAGLRWEARTVVAALAVLLHQEDPDGLQMVLGLACRAARECDARKRFVVSAIVNRVGQVQVPSSDGGTPSGAACGGAGDAPSAGESEGGSVISVVSAPRDVGADSAAGVAAARGRLFAACLEYINDVKSRAVSSTFLQPATYYCVAQYDDSVLGDLDVHGVSTFLAMMQVW